MGTALKDRGVALSVLQDLRKAEGWEERVRDLETLVQGKVVTVSKERWTIMSGGRLIASRVQVKVWS